MPELPEVETIRRQLCAVGVEGRVIEKVHIEWPRTVEPLAPPVFCKQVKGRTVEKIDRHGKWLIFRLSGNENLLVHLRMTGGFYLSQGALKKGPHDRAILQLSGGLNLHFRDPRKFGRWRLATSLTGLGPDALTVTKKEFFQCLEKQNKVLKALLLDADNLRGEGVRRGAGDQDLVRIEVPPVVRHHSIAIVSRHDLRRNGVGYAAVHHLDGVRGANGRGRQDREDLERLNHVIGEVLDHVKDPGLRDRDPLGVDLACQKIRSQTHAVPFSSFRLMRRGQNKISSRLLIVLA